MAKVITCDCGYVMRADTETEVVDQANEHIRSDHPDLIGKLSDDDLVAMIEEV
jgi:predicted small metal-binding protein